MPFSYILQRLRYYRVSFGVLVLLLAFTAGYFGFVPLYARSLAAEHLERARLSPDDSQVFVNDTIPLLPEVDTFLNQYLGDTITEIDNLSRTQDMTCGLRYAEGEPFSGAMRSLNCYQISTYPDLSKWLTLKEGRFPEIRDVAASDVMGEAQVESLLMEEIAQKLDITVGDHIVFGSVVVEIVGIVEQVNPEHPFWNGQEILISGVFTPVGTDLRYDFAVFVLPEAFESHIKDAAPEGVLYSKRIQTDTGVITVPQLAGRAADFALLEQQLVQLHPLIALTSKLPEFVTSNLAQINAIGGGLLMLSCVVVLIMTGLIFHAAYNFLSASPDWQIMSERGAGIRQLVRWTLWSMALPALLAYLVGFLVALLLLVIFRQSWPPTVPAAEMVLLELIGVLAGWGAVGGAMYYLLHHPAPNHPTTPPAVMRLYVDVVLLIIGAGLMLRLYLVRGGTLQTSVLLDPFDLIAPVMFVSGAVLFLLRLVTPLSKLFTPPLFGFSRKPGYRVWELVLLVATLTVGIVGVSLAQTQENQWQITALRQTGGDVRVTYDQSLDYETLPDVESAARIINIYNPTTSSLAVIGIDPDEFGAAFPEWRSQVERLKINPDERFSGLLLPPEAVELSLQLYADISDTPVDVEIALKLRDRRGVHYAVPMEGAEVTEEYVQFTALLPEGNEPPMRLLAFELNSTSTEELFSHKIFLDDITALLANGEMVVVEDFEEINNAWQTLTSSSQRQATYVQTTSQPYTGERSLLVDYRMQPDISTLVIINVKRLGAAPVLMSTHAAATLDQRQRFNVGDVARINERMPLGQHEFDTEIEGLINRFPTVETERFIVMDADFLRWGFNDSEQRREFYDWNEAWLNLSTLQPTDALTTSLENYPLVVYASDTYNDLRLRPLDNAVTGLLRVSFWVLLLMTGVVFVFSFRDDHAPVLMQLGFPPRQIRMWRLLENLTLLLFAALIGIGSAVLLVYLLLPLLVSIPGDQLLIPPAQVALLVGLVAAIAALFGLRTGNG